MGGALKRTGDEIVGRGQDVDTFDKFFKIVQENVRSIYCARVTETEIASIDKKIPKNLKPT